MPVSGEVMKRRIEERKSLDNETRKLQAIEQIADALLNIQVDVAIMSANFQASIRK